MRLSVLPLRCARLTGEPAAGGAQKHDDFDSLRKKLL